jgi:hypothetical protein
MPSMPWENRPGGSGTTDRTPTTFKWAWGAVCTDLFDTDFGAADPRSCRIGVLVYEVDQEFAGREPLGRCLLHQ